MRMWCMRVLCVCICTTILIQFLSNIVRKNIRKKFLFFFVLCLCKCFVQVLYFIYFIMSLVRPIQF
jgi:hypothetical protein